MRAQLLKFGEAAEARNLHTNQPPEAFQNPQQEKKQEFAALQAKNMELKVAMAARQPILATRPDKEFGPRSHRPLDRTERQTLPEGAVEQLLSDLQQEVQILTQEQEELQHQLQHEQILLGLDGFTAFFYSSSMWSFQTIAEPHQTSHIDNARLPCPRSTHTTYQQFTHHS